MTKAQQSFGRDIQALFDAGASGELTDRQLLERFKAGDNDAAELALPYWSSGMAPWCSAPAARSCATGMRPKTLFRPRF